MSRGDLLKRLFLAVLLAAAGLSAWRRSAAAFTQAPSMSRAEYIRETLKGFRSVQESYFGAEDKEGGDLLQLAVEEAELQIAKDEEEGLIQPVVAQEDLEERALRALGLLSSSYMLKRRTAFFRSVHPKAGFNMLTLDEALASDFRRYRTINASFIPDRVTAAGSEASIDFKYDIVLLDQDGEESKSQGVANFTFLLDDDGKMKLSKMSVPLFGSSAPATINPVRTQQGPPVDSRGGNPPGVSGSVAAGTNAKLVQGSQGWRFTTGSNTSEQSADVSKLPADLTAANAIQEIGSCDLASVKSVPVNIRGKFAPLNLSCYAVRTRDNKYAVMKVKTLTETTATFDWKVQGNGTPNF